MSVISAGNLCKCSFGTVPVPLTSTSPNVQFEKSPVVTSIDTKSLISFGMCSTPSNPAVLSIIIASQGKVLVAPCVSNVVTTWMNTKMNVLSCGKPVCTEKSTCQCMWGGVISITNIKNFTVL
ncbi:MAG: DUF4280 domain-containing protein [Alphaproteobacteria bacterium]|nr:DUF4280 domain-containing protein [Alphaproteobacteria bacterium]